MKPNLTIAGKSYVIDDPEETIRRIQNLCGDDPKDFESLGITTIDMGVVVEFSDLQGIRGILKTGIIECDVMRANK
jgi:hypothetical protein